MKITNIKQQTKNHDRVSFFIDETYSFSLSINQWQETGLKVGDELSDLQLVDLKKQSDAGKLWVRVLDYIARRRRSEFEIRQYLRKKDIVDEDEIESILTKLRRFNYVDDAEFARAWARDRHLLKPTSLRKIRMELQQKGIDQHIISQVLEESELTDTDSLRQLIVKKRRQARYQDDVKLTAYLVRQGFSYSDVKAALDEPEDQPS